MLTFQNEGLGTYWDAALPLWKEHYKEVGSSEFEMDLDRAFYGALEESGQLQITTARLQGELVGYVVLLIRKHPHYRALCGFEDAYFLHPSARKGAAGRKMIQASLMYAGARGVKKVFFHSKTSKDLSRLYSTMGFSHSDEIWSKVL